MKETSVIYAQMKEELERKTGVSLSDGGDMALRLYAVAAELETLWAQVQWTLNQSFPQTASGDLLDLHAQARELERSSGDAAQGHIRFEIDEARSEPITIASGTVCLNAGGLEFVTTAEATIEAEELYCAAHAACKTKGIIGNVPAESVIYMALAPIGIARCYNPEAFLGGTDDESDDGLRTRVLESFASLPNGSNKAFYETEARNTDGVAAVCVLPKNRGLGTVDIIISSFDGVPSAELVSSVKDKLETRREICVDVEVFAPTAVTVPVSVAIKAEDGFDYDTVAANVSAALTQYFSGKLLGKDVLLAKLGYVVFGVDGVSNYSILLPSADIIVSADELPVAGTISVTRR